ncbi:Cytochrome b5 [Carabus blaptoides fortunei]
MCSADWELTRAIIEENEQTDLAMNQHSIRDNSICVYSLAVCCVLAVTRPDALHTNVYTHHPGGGDLILDEAGKDATKAFNDFGHSTEAKNIMKKYKIGELVEEDKKQNKTKIAKGPKVKTSEDIQNARSCMAIITCGCLA